MSQSVKYVSLDVRKDTIAVAVAEVGERSEVRAHGEIANTPAAVSVVMAGGQGADKGGLASSNPFETHAS